GNGVDSWEQEAIGRVETALSSSVRVSAEQRLAYSDGTIDRDATLHIHPRSIDPLAGSAQLVQQSRGTSLRSTTTLRGEFSTRYRLRNTVELVYDLVEGDFRSDDQVLLKHRLDYDGRVFDVRMENDLTKGSISGQGVAQGGLIQSGAFGSADWTYQHTTSMSYSPGRAWEVTGDIDYLWQKGDAGSNSDLTLEESVAYNFYTVNGLVRRIGLLKQEALYQRFQGSNGEVLDASRYSLLAEYYPTRRILLGAELKYNIPVAGDGSVTTSLVAAANFEKLQLRLEYGYGTSDDADEQRWEVNVRKIF
ncbi:MAG: hypothetical protein D6751_04455, partial [Deltaproteobacteria bacterium]